MRLAPCPTLVATIVACSLAMAGCGSDRGTDADAQRPSPKEPKVTTLLEQDFDAARPTGWIAGDRGRFAGKALVLRAKPGEVARSGATQDLDLEDVHVSVTGLSADIVGDDGTFGVVCRWVFDDKGTSRDYYSFTIAPNGYAAIGTSRDILWQTTKEPVDAIDQGTGARNELRAECIGDRLSLYVNDELVKTVIDDSIARGDVGVVLENYGKRRTITAKLDDFAVAQVG